MNTTIAKIIGGAAVYGSALAFISQRMLHDQPQLMAEMIGLCVVLCSMTYMLFASQPREQASDIDGEDYLAPTDPDPMIISIDEIKRMQSISAQRKRDFLAGVTYARASIALTHQSIK